MLPLELRAGEIAAKYIEGIVWKINKLGKRIVYVMRLMESKQQSHIASGQQNITQWLSHNTILILIDYHISISRYTIFITRVSVQYGEIFQEHT